MPLELVCVAPRKLEWREYSEVPLSTGQIRIRSEFGATKHGTEMMVYKGVSDERGQFDPQMKLFCPPTKPEPFRTRALGNMIVGRIIETGPGVANSSVNDRVLVYGSFRETHVTEEKNCWKLDSKIPWQSAVCLDPADFALAAVRDGNVRIGDAVAIFGMGAIGLIALQMARLSGAEPIIAVDALPSRLRVAKELGATHTVNPAMSDAGLELKKLTDGRGVDVAIEYSGNPRALQAALRGIAFGGNVVAGAFPPPYGAGLDFGAEAHRNIPNIIFSRACSEPNRDHPRWDNNRIYETCWRLISEGMIRGEAIVQPIVPFSELMAEYPKIETNPDSNIKLGTRF